MLGASVPLLPGSATGDVVVLVRPEAIRIAPAADGAAQVVSASFLGGHGRVIVRNEREELVTVQVGNAEVEQFRPGDRVRLSPRGDRALAVAA